MDNVHIVIVQVHVMATYVYHPYESKVISFHDRIYGYQVKCGKLLLQWLPIPCTTSMAKEAAIGASISEMERIEGEDCVCEVSVCTCNNCVYEW